MKKYLRRGFRAAVDWLVFRAPLGRYGESHEPERCHCYRHIGPVFVGAFCCHVLDYEGWLC